MSFRPNDYSLVIKNLEQECMKDARCYEIHKHYLDLYMKEFGRIMALDSSERTDLDTYRLPRLRGWIMREEKYCKEYKERCLFYNNAVGDFAKITALNKKENKS